MLDAIAVARLDRSEWCLQYLGNLGKGALAVQVQTDDLALFVGQCRQQPRYQSLLLLEIRGRDILGLHIL